MVDAMTNEEFDNANEKLKKLLGERIRACPEFLPLLIEAARVVGWGVDLIEVADFVEVVAEIIGAKPPSPDELEAYL